MSDKHFSFLFNKLDKDRKDAKLYCDVTVSVRNELFPAHRCILGAYCFYFSTLFESDYKDSFDETIIISGPIGDEISPATFQSVLNFCYTSAIRLTKNNIYDILAAAEFLQIDRLKQESVDFLKSMISTENWLKIFKIAVRWNHGSLIDSCMLSYLDVKNKLNLQEFTFEEFNTILRHKSDVLKAEETFEMISSWADHHPDETQRFDQLFQFVHFERMEEKYISHKVVTNHLVMNSVAALQRLVVLRLGERPEDEKFLLLGGEKTKHCVQKYNNDAWQKCAESPRPIYRSAAASNSTHVFVADSLETQGHIQVYDISKDTWSYVENLLKTPRFSATATIIYNKLYLFGGSSSNDACLSSINVITGEPTELQPLHQARECLSAVLISKNIFVMGGNDSADTTLDSVEAYSLDTKQWTMLESMRVPRWGHCATVYKGLVFVIGGKDDYRHAVNNIEVYDPDAKQWKIHIALSAPALKLYCCCVRI